MFRHRSEGVEAVNGRGDPGRRTGTRSGMVGSRLKCFVQGSGLRTEVKGGQVSMGGNEE